MSDICLVINQRHIFLNRVWGIQLLVIAFYARGYFCDMDSYVKLETSVTKCPPNNSK